MSECYDCGELFEGFGNCPKCNSPNVGIIEDDDEKTVEYDFDLDELEEDELLEDRLEDELIADTLFEDDELEEDEDDED